MAVHHSEEFKQEAVRLMERTDRSHSQLALDLGISYWTLRSWYKLHRVGKTSKKASKRGVKTPAPSSETLEERVKRLEAENIELRRENAALEMDRAILKKAAGAFNRSPQHRHENAKVGEIWNKASVWGHVVVTRFGLDGAEERV